MSELKVKSIEKLSDLPNFKASFVETMKEMGITSITDLKEVPWIAQEPKR